MDNKVESHHLLSPLIGFISSLAIFWVAWGLALLAWGYEDSFLQLNQYHLPWLDLLMPHLTHLGEGVILPGIFALFLIRSEKPLVISLILSLIAVLLIVGFAKGNIFDDWFRPPEIFDKQGIAFHYLFHERIIYRSFPSGHATAATTSFLFFAFYAGQKHPAWSWALGFLTGIICYSRVYIGVHFPGDVLAGSVLGALIGGGILLFIYPLFEKKIKNLKPDMQRILEYGLYTLASIMVIASSIALINT